MYAVIAWLIVAGIAWITGPALGHDEAAFATAARGGAPEWLYRSVGVIWIAKVGVALGNSEWLIRLPSLVLGVGVVLATYVAGTAICSRRTGAWAAAVVATAHPMVLRGAELIGDLPATACMLAGIGVIAGELARDEGPRWRLVAAAPAFAAAFYLRYGSAPVIALVAACALAVWWRAIARRPAIIAATAGVFAVLLVPHVVYSLHVTGKVLGVLEASAAMPRRAYVGEGLLSYVTANPFRFYGALIAPLLVAGLCRLASSDRRVVFAACIALGQIVMLGLQSHAQPRYVFVATVLLAILGVDLVACWRRLALLVPVAWLGVLVAVFPYNRWIAEQRGPLIAAARTIRDDDSGARCAFVARVVTQLMWYTRCDGILLRDPARLPAWPAGKRLYIVSVPRATADVESILAARPATPTPLVDMRVWRITADTGSSPPGT